MRTCALRRRAYGPAHSRLPSPSAERRRRRSGPAGRPCRGTAQCCGSRYPGDVGDRQAVAGLDIGEAEELTLVAGLQADRSEDVALLAVLVLDESDERGAVRVVLQAQNGGGMSILVALEVDDAVLLLVAAAVMANGDAAVAVAAGILLLAFQQADVRAWPSCRSPRRRSTVM